MLTEEELSYAILTEDEYIMECIKGTILGVIQGWCGLLVAAALIRGVM
jgi:hypothetical protein